MVGPGCLKRILVCLAGVMIIAGCAPKGKVADGVKPLVAEAELSSSELLDVAIVIFTSEELS